MSTIAFGLFGLIVGSFLNVLIIRGGVRPLSGRSACMSCGQRIRWYDLIPLFSWAWLGGRCRFCRSKISPQYILVELTTALLFAAVGASALPIISRLFALPIIAILIAIAVYDLRHTIIPDAWVWIFNALALFYSLLAIRYLPFTVFLAGPAVALPLFLLWLVSHGRWMGLGDAKLALGIGWLLGPFYGVAALFLAFVLGAVIGLLAVFFSSAGWRAIAKRFIPRPFWRGALYGITMKSEVPFGPFLVAACLLVLFSLAYDIPLPFIWQ
jgi:leader peptidase (prepilin peptidase) / N-methyltransferase